MRAWSFAVPLLAALAACGGTTSTIASTSLVGPGSASSSSNVDAGQRRFVQNGVVHVSLEDFDRVGFFEADLHEAEQTRRAVNVELERSYQRQGHRRWFFHSFDRRSLDFVVARYQRSPQKGARYVAEHRIRVRRTPEAERALGVFDTVRQYELGDRGVKPGMGRTQVESKLGKAQRELPLGSAGAFDMLYPSLCVRFVDDRVAHVWQRPRCALRP